MLTLAFLLAAQDAEAADIMRRLDATPVTLRLEGAYLPDAVSLISDFTGVPIVIREDALEGLAETDLYVNMRVAQLPARTVLRLLLRNRTLTLVVRDGIATVVPIEEVEHNVVTRIYDIRDLTFRIEDFPAPIVEFGIPRDTRGGFATSSRNFLADLFDTPAVTNEISQDVVIELIETHTGRDTWTENPRVTITDLGGRLVIAQSPEVHEQIEELLDVLRRSR